MAQAVDVARHILAVQGPMTAWKLQKLVYYSQAWHLVWEDAPLFNERIEAWANGPVAPALYRVHQGQFEIDELPSGDPGALTEGERESITVVLRDYGGRSAQWLSELTHMEDPWRLARARAGAGPGERCSEEILQEDMALYYGGLLYGAGA